MIKIRLFCLILCIVLININPIQSVSTECLNAFRQAALDSHNKLRASHDAPALVRQDNIDQTSLEYAKKLAIENKFDHSDQAGVGENLYVSFTKQPEADAAFCSAFGEDCVQSWYDEINDYNFEAPSFSGPTGHFTQMVWKSSTGIGLGMGQGISGNWNAFYCVAQYSPAGNVITSDNSFFRENVLPITDSSGQTSFTITENVQSNGKVSTECLNAFRTTALDKHNILRAKHSSPALVRDANIDQTSLEHAEKLARDDNFVHSDQKGVGENIFAYYTTDSKVDIAICSAFGEKCVQAWYDEIKSYNFNRPGYSSATGHFTQMVWKSSTGIGLGMSQGLSNDWIAFYCVAQYTPPGNVVTSDNLFFRRNVLPGRIEIAEQPLIAKKNVLPSITDTSEQPAIANTDNEQSNEKVSTECLNAFRNAALDSHNKFRAFHNAPALVRQANVDKTALEHAEKLARTNKFEHSGQKDVGENFGFALHISRSAVDAAFCSSFGEKCAKQWYEKIKAYDFNKPGYSKDTSEFTQLVWKSSTGIGLGMAQMQGRSNNLNNFYCVAQYTPPGNLVTKDNWFFRRNVSPLRTISSNTN